MTVAWYGDGMSTSVAMQEPDLQEFEGMPAPPPDLAPIVEDLCGRNVQVVTLDDLAAYDTGREPKQVARRLREQGWLFPLPVQGAWGVSTAISPSSSDGFMVLRARLRAKPTTPVCVGGRSAAQIRGWLRRPTVPTISYFGTHRPPACLAQYHVERWRHQIPLDEIDGLPVWKPETLLAHMSAHPGRFPWSDIAEWLWELCDPVNHDLLAAELAGHPTAVWARAAYLLHRGERTGIAENLIEHVDVREGGPHYFGRRVARIDDRSPWMPVWSSRFNVIDYLVERNWSDDFGK